MRNRKLTRAAPPPSRHTPAASVPALRIVRWRRVSRPITTPVTKFGGQPVWIDGPRWPLGRRLERPMRFLQLSVADRDEFVLNIPSTLFAFIHKNGKRGAMLAQH